MASAIRRLWPQRGITDAFSYQAVLLGIGRSTVRARRCPEWLSSCSQSGTMTTRELDIVGRASNRRLSITNRELILAAREGVIPDIQCLLAKGADVNFRDADGNTCLHWAAESGFSGALNLFLNNNAAISEENKQNKTPLDVAWNAANSDRVNAATCITIIGKRILQECDRILKERNKKKSCPEPLVRTSFYEATLLGYHHPYCQNDIESLLKFFCAPFPKLPVQDNILVSITFDLEDNHTINLVHTEKGTYFITSWNSTSHLRSGSLLDKKYTATTVDPTTSALLRVQLACDRLPQCTNSSKERKKKIDELDQQLQGIQNSHESDRKVFAAILKEINRSVEKMESCLRMLEEERPKYFSYKAANMFIFFVETFASADTHLDIIVPTKVKDNIANKKKGYLSRLYQLSDNDTSAKLNTISKFRNRLAHAKSDRVCFISPKTFENFARENLQMKPCVFFDTLRIFTTLVLENSVGAPQPSEADVCKVNELFDKLEENCASFCRRTENTAENTGSLLSEFWANISKMEKVDVHKLIFDLLVNICPNLEANSQHKLSPQLRKLRNVIIHDFQNVSLPQIKRDLPLAMRDLYTYELAGEVHSILVHIREDRSTTNLKKELDDCLKSVNDKYKKLDFNRNSTQQPVESMMNRAYDSTWMEKNIPKVVTEYVSYIAPLFDCVSETDEDDTIMSATPTLDSAQKREVFVQFLHLKEYLSDCDKPEYRERQRFLMYTLMEKLNINEGEADYATNLQNMDSDDQNKQLRDEILHIVKSWYSVLELINSSDQFSLAGHPKMSHQDLVSLCEAFTNGKSVFTFENHDYLLRHSDLSQTQKEFIQGRLQSFPSNMETRDAFSGKRKIQVNIASIVLNLLKIINEAKREELSTIENIAVAFSDDMFVSYLAKNSLKCENKVNALMDIYQTIKIFGDIHDLPFTAPYVATLLASTGDLRPVKTTVLEEVLHLLLMEQTDTCFFESVIALKKDRVTKALAVTLNKYDFSPGKIRKILGIICESGALESCLQQLLSYVASQDDTQDQRSKRLTNILIGANDVVLDRIYADKLEDANSVIELTAKLEDSLVSSGVISRERSITAERNLHKAKLLIQKGRLMQAEEASRLYEQAHEALHLVSEVDDAEHHAMLASSREAYTFSLRARLSSDTGKKLELTKQAFEHQSHVWKLLSKYITGVDDQDPTTYTKVYNRASESARYQKLLSLGGEYWKYLNVPKVRQTMTDYYLNIGIIEKWCFKRMKDLLMVYDEIYDVWKASAENTSWAERGMQIVLLRKSKIHWSLARMYNNQESQLRREDIDYHKIKTIELGMQYYKNEIKMTGPYSKHSCACLRILGSNYNKYNLTKRAT